MSIDRYVGRTAVVTGAAGGIGRACAARLVAEGARVVGIDLDGDAARAAMAEIDPARCTGVGADVADPASAAAAISQACEVLGDSIDLLVNAAGVGGFVALRDLTLEEWDRVLRVNLTGVFVMSQAALDPLLAARGAIVNLASIAGVRAVPYNAAYCASKAGVVLFSKSMAIEFSRQGLRVNAVCPAGVDTAFLANFAMPDDADMSLFTRGSSVIEGPMQPDEVAAAVAFLGSAEAAHITGTTLLLDGGATA